MFKKTRISKSLMLAFGGSIVLAGLPAQAERVTITGSAIKSISAETTLPVTTLNVSELAKAGVTNAEQALQFIASNQSATPTTTSVGASTGGASFADLRGLGAARTLVLVNGKRMVNNAYNSGIAAVDLNAIPYGAVERIEVLQDGASAIYGSDAISGVVNFITRREYQGVSVNGSITLPTTSGGGDSWDLGITGGYGSLAEQGWNIFGSVTYRSQDALKSTDREYAKTSFIPSRGVNKTSGTSFPGNYVQSGLAGTYNPSHPACDPPFSIESGGICRFDYVPFIDIIPKQEQLAVMAKGSFQVNKDNVVSLEFLQANNTVSTKISPTPLTGNPMSADNPYFPGAGITAANPNPLFNPNGNISVGWRQTELGGRASEPENKTDRFLLQWEGNYMNWDYNVSALSSNSNIKNQFTGGYVSSSGVRAGLVTGAGTAAVPWLNPFGPQTAEGLAYLKGQQVIGQVQEAEGRLTGISATASGEVYKLPAGPMTMAVGLEYYKDKVDYTNNFTLIRQAASSGLELAEDASGSRDWWGVMAELNIPVVKDFEVNLALRYDDYSDFGSTWNPKISGRWTPTKELLVRGSWNSGFRAASLYDTYGPASVTFTGNPYDDPVLCPGGVLNVAAGGVQSRDCGQQFQQQQGGNTNVQPETSQAWTVGLVFQPTPSSSVSVDYWNYVVKDSINVIGEQVIFGDTTKYANNFVRCSQVSPTVAASLSTCPIPGGDPLAYIINTITNLGEYKTSGFDFSANWRSDATQYGRFSAGWIATYVLNYEYQLEAGGVFNDNLGVYFNGQPVSNYRHSLNLGWQYDAWQTNLINRYSRGYIDENGVDPQFYNKVGSINTWDLTVTWTGIKNLSLQAGLLNIFDQEPPFSNQGGGFQVGYDYRYANPIGRAFMLRGSYSF